LRRGAAILFISSTSDAARVRLGAGLSEI
jgi:hypothetical protein